MRGVRERKNGRRKKEREKIAKMNGKERAIKKVIKENRRGEKKEKDRRENGRNEMNPESFRV